MKEKHAHIHEREDRRLFLHPYTFVLEEKKEDNGVVVNYNLRLVVGGRPQVIPREAPCYISPKRTSNHSKETRK